MAQRLLGNPPCHHTLMYYLVPAEILDHLSSSDVTVQEGETVTLVCNATGTPQPKVTWFRIPSGASDSRQSELCPGTDQVGMNGEVLLIHNVTRDCGESYQCMAFNEVEPPAFKTIKVYVEFAPEIYLPNKRIGQGKGRETILECTVTAFPHAVTYWQKAGHRITTSSHKYRLDVYEDGGNRLTLSLRVFDIDDSDYGPYTCIASNKIGEDAETMFLYNYAKTSGRSTTTTTTTTTAPFLPPTSPSMLLPVTPRRRRPTDQVDLMSNFKTEDEKRGHDNVNWSGRQGSFGSRQEGHYATQHPRYTPQNSDTRRIMAGKSSKKDSADRLTVNSIALLLILLALTRLL
ncbi:opioid-binding protein/cell adhesion molecule [Plakobranchus ocellatus]|uniref:Opioid-binding protein/cell adhesion molecule n=1 Tax=Plakobranchus ocellatus TaxID=259542 RepID=A0AAV4C2R0_9GAST|nr:opioid-binding protein/cell adhesion molecule [Plakobranchus ocellatus]